MCYFREFHLKVMPSSAHVRRTWKDTITEKKNCVSCKKVPKWTVSSDKEKKFFFRNGSQIKSFLNRPRLRQNLPRYGEVKFQMRGDYISLNE
jgi:hypothetical protein